MILRSLLIVALLAGAAAADTAGPPATLVSGEAARGAKQDPVFKLLEQQRLACKFTEQKHVALLARPLSSTGTIVFDRDKGIVRAVVTPKPQTVVLTKTSLKIVKGKTVEEIPLDKSKDLKAFAMIFPTLLRGERAALEKSFDIGLYGSDADWWALTFAPKSDALKKFVKTVTVFGKKTDVVALRIVEASGDSTDTQLTDVRRNKDVPDTEIAAAFGAN
jgi:outer membrane lipoprotein-sorting protein